MDPMTSWMMMDLPPLYGFLFCSACFEKLEWCSMLCYKVPHELWKLAYSQQSGYGGHHIIGMFLLWGIDNGCKISGLKAHPCGGWLLAWQFWQFYASGGFWVHLKSYVYVHVMSLGYKSVRWGCDHWEDNTIAPGWQCKSSTALHKTWPEHLFTP